jgi:hypothetical protein
MFERGAPSAIRTKMRGPLISGRLPCKMKKRAASGTRTLKKS